MTAEQKLSYAIEPTQNRRWFNMVGDRIERAEAKGYKPVLEDGQPVIRAVSRDGETKAMLMEVPKVKRNLEKFFTHRKGISPNIKARILRLNPTIEEGDKVRGWNPVETAWWLAMRHGVMGKGMFIAKNGREAWDDLPRSAIMKRGKRAYVTLECVADQSWKYEQIDGGRLWIKTKWADPMTAGLNRLA